MHDFKRVYQHLIKQRDNRIEGKLNCIPWGFPKFEMYNPGLEQGRFYLVSANSKVTLKTINYI